MGCGPSTKVPEQELTREEKIILEREKELQIHIKTVQDYDHKIPNTSFSLDKLRELYNSLGIRIKLFAADHSGPSLVFSGLATGNSYSAKTIRLLGILLCKSNEEDKADVLFSIYNKEKLNSEDLEGILLDLSAVAIKLVWIADNDRCLTREHLHNYHSRLAEAQIAFCTDMKSHCMGLAKEIGRSEFIKAFTYKPERRWMLWSYGLRILIDKKFTQLIASGLIRNVPRKQLSVSNERKDPDPDPEPTSDEELDRENENPHCDAGHSLEFREDSLEYYRALYGPTTTINCEICSYNVGSSSWQCRVCNYDLCSACGDFFKNAPKHQNSRILCSRNHRLRRVDIGEFYAIRYCTAPTFLCVYCQSIKQGESWHCRRCLFDMCLECVEKLEKSIACEGKVKCARDHKVKFVSSLPIKYSGVYNCDGCQKSFENVGAFHCKQCNYDLCVECMLNR